MSVNTIYNTPILSQVGAFSPIVLSSPGTDGNYRISLYMWSPTFGQTNKDIIVNVSWVDPSGTTQNFSIGLFTANAAINSVRGDTTFRAVAGTNITLSTGLNANDVSDAFNLYPNLEQL